jgi:hypothetical protein
MSVKVKIGNVFVSVRDGRKILAEYNRKFKISGVRTMKGAELNAQLSKFRAIKTTGGKYRFAHRVRTGFKSKPYHLFGTGATRVAGKMATMAKRSVAAKEKVKAGKVAMKAKAKAAKAAAKLKAKKAKERAKLKAKKDKAKMKAAAKKEKMKAKKAAAKAKAKAKKKPAKKKVKKVKAAKDPHPPTGKTYPDGQPKFKGLNKDGSKRKGGKKKGKAKSNVMMI